MAPSPFTTRRNVTFTHNEHTPNALEWVLPSAFFLCHKNWVFPLRNINSLFSHFVWIFHRNSQLNSISIYHSSRIRHRLPNRTRSRWSKDLTDWRRGLFYFQEKSSFSSHTSSALPGSIRSAHHLQLVLVFQQTFYSSVKSVLQRARRKLLKYILDRKLVCASAAVCVGESRRPDVPKAHSERKRVSPAVVIRVGFEWKASRTDKVPHRWLRWRRPRRPRAAWQHTLPPAGG